MKKTVRTLLALALVLGTISCEELTNEPDDNTGNLIENDIVTNTTWSTGKTYIISGSVNVSGAILTIEPGTTIKFESGAQLSIGYSENSTLIANGTADKPIVFTSNAAIPSAGAWNGIYFWNNNMNSSMTYCKIEYAGRTSDGAVQLIGTSLIFSNNQISYAKDYGIELDQGSWFTEMNHNQFSNCGKHPVRLYAAYMHTIGDGNVLDCADGFGVNVIADDVAGTVTWKKLDKPYYVEGNINVNDATLTIEPGAVFKFNADGKLSLGYSGSTTLVANGTETENIVFTSSAPVPAAGAWQGIAFWWNTLASSSMSYCEVNFAGKSSTGALNAVDASFALNNCKIHNSSAIGIVMSGDSYFTSMSNNIVQNIASHALQMDSERLGTIGLNNTFTCNTGYGINVTDGDVTATSTWGKQTVPYYINVGVNINANLTIEAGTVMLFGADGQIDIGYSSNAQVTAIGTLTEPIIFSSSAASPAAGAWYGIQLWWNNLPNTKFDYCEFNFAGKGSDLRRSAVHATGTSFIASNSKFQSSSGWGIYLDKNCSVTGTGNTFISCALGDIGQDPN